MRPCDAELLGLLDQLEMQLRHLELWSAEPPPATALASQVPFCYDTLSLAEWLQWVFLPQMRVLLATAAPWPGVCGIAPLAEIEFAEEQETMSGLIGLLGRIDRTVSEHSDHVH